MSNNFKFDSTDHVLTENRVFTPDQSIVEKSNIFAYMQKKGFSDYKDFYKWLISVFAPRQAERSRALGHEEYETTRPNSAGVEACTTYCILSSGENPCNTDN